MLPRTSSSSLHEDGESSSCSSAVRGPLPLGSNIPGGSRPKADQGSSNHSGPLQVARVPTRVRTASVTEAHFVERYNIVSEADLEEAARRFEDFGHILDKVDDLGN